MKRTSKPDYEPYWNHFTSVSHEINKKIRRILEDKDQNGIVKEAQLFYRSCVDFQEQEQFNFRDLQVLLELYYNRWMNKQKHIDWVEEIMGITKTFNIHPIFKFHINIDYKNTRRYVPYVSVYFIFSYLLFIYQICRFTQSCLDLFVGRAWKPYIPFSFVAKYTNLPKRNKCLY